METKTCTLANKCPDITIPFTVEASCSAWSTSAQTYYKLAIVRILKNYVATSSITFKMPGCAGNRRRLSASTASTKVEMMFDLKSKEVKSLLGDKVNQNKTAIAGIKSLLLNKDTFETEMVKESLNVAGWTGSKSVGKTFTDTYASVLAAFNGDTVGDTTQPCNGNGAAEPAACLCAGGLSAHGMHAGKSKGCKLGDTCTKGSVATTTAAGADAKCTGPVDTQKAEVCTKEVATHCAHANKKGCAKGSTKCGPCVSGYKPKDQNHKDTTSAHPAFCDKEGTNVKKKEEPKTQPKKDPVREKPAPTPAPPAVETVHIRFPAIDYDACCGTAAKKAQFLAACSTAFASYAKAQSGESTTRQCTDVRQGSAIVDFQGSPTAVDQLQAGQSYPQISAPDGTVYSTAGASETSGDSDSKMKGILFLVFAVGLTAFVVSVLFFVSWLEHKKCLERAEYESLGGGDPAEPSHTL